MSFAVSPQVVKASAPTANDDSSRGFVVGSIWVDTTTAPDAVYIRQVADAEVRPKGKA